MRKLTGEFIYYCLTTTPPYDSLDTPSPLLSSPRLSAPLLPSIKSLSLYLSLSLSHSLLHSQTTPTSFYTYILLLLYTTSTSSNNITFFYSFFQISLTFCVSLSLTYIQRKRKRKMRLWCLCSLLVLVVLGQGQEDVGGGGGRKEMVPAMFIFGDSLIDNGNNNNLATLAKANYFPYGIDFQAGPTGRFSNGYTMVDEIAQLLGLPLIPPYAQASGQQLLHGVNYASAAAGILDITGRNFMGRIPFNQQIINFQNTLDQISNYLGATDLAQALSRSIFFVGMGSNDYLNNYLMPNYPTRNQYTGTQYADLLVQEYNQQLIRLYNLGARKFVLAGLGLMGCIPSILAQSPNGVCSEEVNQLVLPFNANMKFMIDNLSANLPGSHFIFINIHNMFKDILTNNSSYGFSVINKGCCGIGRNSGQITCLPLQTPCSDRNHYVFWDAFHPTEAVNIIMGRKSFSGDQSVAYPMNIEQLAKL